MKFLIKFLKGLWYFRDIKESWQDAKMYCNKENQKELKQIIDTI